MRIVFDARVLRHKIFSGVENYTDFILKALKTKVEVDMVQPTSSNKYIQHLWEHIRLPFLSLSARLLFCPANIAPLYLFRKIKLVLTLHDVAFKTFPNSVSKFFYWYYSFLIPKNIKRADQIITISQTSKEEIIRFYPDAEGKVTVIPLGVHEKYRYMPEITKEKQILCVGSINVRKNVISVIEAYEMLPENLGYKLVIVGNFFGNFSLDEKTMRIFERATKNDNIIFKQNLDDEALICEYNRATCLIFPSFYEGFGLPPLEAMACGTPVIVSNASSMPEVCGDAAVYIDPYDINDISTKMQKLLKDKVLQKKMISKGFERAESFSWERAVQEHIKLFEKVLAK